MSAELLQFPQRNNGRVRRSRSPDAMGRCSIGRLERDGEAIPKNVVDVRRARTEQPVDEARLALRLALGVYALMDADRKDKLRRMTRICALHDDGRLGDEARELLRLLTGEQLPC